MRPGQIGNLQTWGSLRPETSSLSGCTQSHWASGWRKQARGISEKEVRVYLNFAITLYFMYFMACILWPVSMFAIRKAARKIPFLLFKLICPKHPLRVGARPKGSGWVCRPHVNSSVITEQWETHVYNTRGQQPPISNLLICSCSITQPACSKLCGKSRDNCAKASHTEWLTYILPVLLQIFSSPHILGNRQKKK